jgi:hypothetical protein
MCVAVKSVLRKIRCGLIQVLYDVECNSKQSIERNQVCVVTQMWTSMYCIL